MTEQQREIALALGRVTFYPGSRMNRFASDMCAIASNPGSTKKITPGQHCYLVLVALKFRRQLPQSVVLMAERLNEELQGHA